MDKSLDRPPTAGEFLDPLAAGRGFRTSRGQPDRSRSARLAIKDFLQGRLLHVHPPPSCADHQLFHSSTVETEKDQVKLERRLKMVETKMLQVKKCTGGRYKVHGEGFFKVKGFGNFRKRGFFRKRYNG